MNKLHKEITAIMQLSPFKYPPAKYKSPQQQFKVILNELYERGVQACVIPEYQRKKNIGHGQYIYSAQINFVVVRHYKTSHGAKMRILREYLKLINNGKKKQSA